MPTSLFLNHDLIRHDIFSENFSQLLHLYNEIKKNDLFFFTYFILIFKQVTTALPFENEFYNAFNCRIKITELCSKKIDFLILTSNFKQGSVTTISNYEA